MRVVAEVNELTEIIVSVKFKKTPEILNIFESKVRRFIKLPKSLNSDTGKNARQVFNFQV
jgi:hypothetical protein